jgi:hypothetical protein
MIHHALELRGVMRIRITPLAKWFDGVQEFEYKMVYWVNEIDSLAVYTDNFVEIGSLCGSA